MLNLGYPGFKVRRHKVNDLKYADDTVLIAQNKEDLPGLLYIVKEEKAERKG